MKLGIVAQVYGVPSLQPNQPQETTRLLSGETSLFNAQSCVVLRACRYPCVNGWPIDWEVPMGGQGVIWAYSSIPSSKLGFVKTSPLCEDKPSLTSTNLSAVVVIF